MVITFLATLLRPLQFAVLTGILISFAVYIMGTSVPRVVSVLPTEDFSHFSPVVNQPSCTQLGILDIYGDLYFGASSHIEEEVWTHLEKNPNHRYLLLRLFSVDQIDISGVHVLESIIRSLREQGGDVFMVRTQDPVMAVFRSTGFCEVLGEDHFLEYDEAIEYLFFKTLDPAICIYECDARVFKECKNLPRPRKDVADGVVPLSVPTKSVEKVSATELWQEQHQRMPPIVVDIREPREYGQGHIPQALSIPMFKLLSDPSQLHQIRPVVLVCRSGRRSSRAIVELIQKGFDNIRILEGGMLAWESAGLLEAVDRWSIQDEENSQNRGIEYE
jgi:SulP family sulfate permease